MMTRPTSSAFCMEAPLAISGAGEGGLWKRSAGYQRAMAGNARRQRRHSRQRWQRGVWKLQNLNGVDPRALT